MRGSVAVLTLLGVITCLSSGPAQEPPAAKSQRSYVSLHNSDAAGLADVLAKHFKGDATILVLPPTSGNAILITAPPAITEEVLALLAKLDRAPRSIEIEVTMVEVFTKKAAFEKGAEAEFTGPAAEVHARLKALNKASQLGVVSRIKVTAAEGQPVQVTTGGNKAITTGGAVGGKGGFATKSINYMPVGTTAKFSAKVAGDDTALVEVDLKDNRVKVGEAGAAGADEPAEMTNTMLTTRVSVPAGRAVAVQAVRTAGKGGDTIALVIVQAKVLDAGK